jgi:oligosaccharyl transferase (archaeosortase A-associated)
LSQQTPERKRKLPPAAIAAIAMAVVAGIALYMRIALPWNQVFVNGQVWFLETDSSFYMRNIQVIVQHFPHFNAFDPYMLFPGGQAALVRPFFAGLVSLAILLVRGATTLYHMEVIAAFIPPILGALTLIPVYFIGKELFNRWVGVIAALLVAILPTEFLHRSLLGFLDHHVAEVLFTTVAALFLIMAIKRAREKGMSFDNVLKRDWAAIRKPLIYTLLASIFLGFYLLTWQGGVYFVFLIFVYLAIQFVIDHMNRKSTDYLCIIGTPVFLIAFLMLLPVLGGSNRDNLYVVAMTIAVLVPVILNAVSRLMKGRNLRPVYYPLSLLGLLGIGLAIFHAINPSEFTYMFHQFGSVFIPSGASLTISEVHPLTPQIAWGYFNTAFYVGFISLVMVIYLAVKEKSADKTFFIVWSIITLSIIVFGQRRFSYYYAINVSLLAGYFTWKMLDLVGLRKILGKPKEAAVGVVKQFRKKKKRTTERPRKSRFMQPRGAWRNVIIVGILLLVVVALPSVVPFKHDTRTGAWSFGFPSNETETARYQALWAGLAIYTAEVPKAYQITTADWNSAASWLLETNNVTGQPNTPDPFGNPDFYYDLYPPKSQYTYPSSAYGVMSWWDYGYFIMQLGHRIPNANPTQSGAVNAGLYFTDTDVASANELADKLGTKYVMIDYLMATEAKFYAMAAWAGNSSDNFYGPYLVPAEYTGTGNAQFAEFFYPEYYQSMAARLYCFDGEAQNATSPVVISYDNKTDATTGFQYRQVTFVQPFATYESAQAYVAQQTTGNWKIIGASPFLSIVPLEAMSDYELVYSTGATSDQGTVKVFQYLGGS